MSTQVLNSVDEFESYSVYIVTIQSIIIKFLTEAIKDILPDTNIEVSKEGVRILSMDPTHTTLVHMNLGCANFEKFHVTHNQIIGVNMINLFKLIKTITNNDTLALFVHKNDMNHLGVKIENSSRKASTTFKLNLMDLNNGNIRIKAGSNDAGQFLMALNVLERAQGGRLLLTLDQRDTAGEMDGVLRVTDIKLQKMPLLAELLNAMSIVGLLDQLTGPGVIMNEIDAVFRITDDQIIVQSASALGPSMGITLDGYYNLESKTFDMQGFFSPLYLVNGIGSILSRKGEGFFGFGFNLEGTTDRPRFIINPLSAITPTILRDLFRRPPPKLE